MALSKSPHWQIALLAVLAALWVALSALVVLGRGDVEAYLLSIFKDSARPDAFVRLNPTFRLMWIAHSCLSLFGLVAVMVHKRDLFTVLIIGPFLAFAIALFSQQWSDPDWNTFAGVCVVGWLASIVAGGVYWLCGCGKEPRDTGDSRHGENP
jgi:hypothetical protein